MLSDDEGATDVIYSLSHTRESADGDNRYIGDTESVVLPILLWNKLTYMYKLENWEYLI